MPSQPNKTTPASPVDTIIHLGAGYCSELETYLQHHPKTVLLIEADPELAEELQERTVDLPEVKVKNVAVAAQTGPATFRRYNLPDVNSLHMPNDLLLELFPGLKTLEELPVQTVTPVPILEPLNLQAKQENYLIVDLPGEEFSVLKALHIAQQLHLFRHVQVYCNHQPLHENTTTAADIQNWLQKQGYDLDEEVDSKDPDRLTLSFHRNDLLLHNLELEQQLKQIQKSKEALDLLVSDQEKQIHQLTNERDQQLQLTQEYKQEIQNLIQARNEATKQAKEQLTRIEIITKEREDEAQRQHLLDEELIKAEAQIQLISDILVREKSF